MVLCGLSVMGHSAWAGDNWPQFRGPGGGGVGRDPDLPETWSATQNIEWKTAVPGRSWSSPIVWEEKVFLTTVINLGEGEAPKKGLYLGGNRPEPPKSEHEFKVLCLNLESGEVVWEKLLHRGQPRTAIHLKGSYGAQTPVTDGKRVYAVFGGLGIFALTLDGREVWSKPLEPFPTRNGWGYAASPVVDGDRLFLVNDNEERSEVFALDTESGRERWRVEREEKSNWATPLIWENDLRTELVTAGTGAVRSYDLEGNPLWRLRGMSGIVIPTPVAGGGLLYVSSGFVGDKLRPLYAIRPGAEGDITLEDGESANDFIAWSDPTGGPYNPSPLYYDGHVYVLFDRGLLSCYNATSGELLYDRERLPRGFAFTASPWAAGDNLFCLNEDGACYVVRAGARFELRHINRLAEDDMCMATPAMAGDRLLIRTATRLYCIQSAESQ